MENSATQSITYQQVNAVGVITLNRPEALNTFRVADYERLEQLLTKARADDSVRALVLTGNGSAFSAGQDLSELADPKALEDTALQRERLDQMQNLTRMVVAYEKPTIAAFNGFAVGFGLEISLACDIRLCVPEAYFMFPESTRGLLQTNGVLWLLPRLVGMAACKQMLLTGGKTNADTALGRGLVSEIIPADCLQDRALQLAQKLAQNSLTSITKTKDILNQTYDLSLEQVLEAETEGFIEMMQTADFEEGVRSFFEKRLPAFTAPAA